MLRLLYFLSIGVLAQMYIRPTSLIHHIGDFLQYHNLTNCFVHEIDKSLLSMKCLNNEDLYDVYLTINNAIM